VLAAAVAVATTAPLVDARLPKVIETEDGPVSGKHDHVIDPTLTEFKGIPFAAPPVKENRFRLPQPVEKWTRTYHATKEKNRCAQADLIKFGHLGTEDCLYLDVTVPIQCTPDNPCPVMQWIYGGAWIIGENDGNGMYDPKTLARKYGVIVVAGNYRLDVFGWLVHAALKDENNGTLGNFGLHDQRAALKWTAANIAKFGGDPNMITLFGESAGGFSVCQHLASPASSGLFSQAIIESGSCDRQSLLVFDAEDASAFGELYAEAVGCPRNDTSSNEDVIACLRKKTVGEIMVPYDDWFNPNWPKPLLGGMQEAAKEAPTNPKNIFHWVEEMTAKSTNVGAGRPPNGTWPKPIPGWAPFAAWAAVVDGTDLGLPDAPLNLFVQDKAARSPTGERVKVMHGTNHDEGVMFMVVLPLVVRGVGPGGYTGLLTDLDVDLIFDDLAGYRPTWPKDAREQILAMYPKDKYRSHSGLGTNVARVAAAARDMIFTCGTRRAGRALVEQGHEVYHYQWNHEFTGWRNVSSCDNLLFLCGNYHASELTYVWQKHLNSLNKNDRDMTAVIGTYWTNFAKNGDPNIGMSPADITGDPNTTAAYWAPFNHSVQSYMSLQVPGLGLGTDLWHDECDMYDKFEGFPS